MTYSYMNSEYLDQSAHSCSLLFFFFFFFFFCVGGGGGGGGGGYHPHTKSVDTVGYTSYQ